MQIFLYFCLRFNKLCEIITINVSERKTILERSDLLYTTTAHFIGIVVHLVAVDLAILILPPFIPLNGSVVK